ncbi:ParB/RepB/Spo0J family partition protein [Bacillus anthracis]|nr:ParB/RepB/Spo0J family partition protein [Bacillus anthracis]
MAGNVISIAGSIVEMFEGISLIGGSNFLTIVAEVGTGGLASPIVIPLDIVATAAGASLFAHGGFVWNKSIQNTKDTIQKFESSPSSGERVNKVKENGKLNKEENATKGMDNAGEKTSGLNSSVKNVNPSEIRFSQTSVNGSEELIASMKANGWKGDPIDVVKMPDGKLTTIDNTRVAAAREVGIEVQATIRNYKDPLPTNLIDRFTTKREYLKLGEKL